MPHIETVDPPLLDALEAIIHFVKETTGRTPTQEELAGALKRYFVMNEIKEHLFMKSENQ